MIKKKILTARFFLFFILILRWPVGFSTWEWWMARMLDLLQSLPCNKSPGSGIRQSCPALRDDKEKKRVQPSPLCTGRFLREESRCKMWLHSPVPLQATVSVGWGEEGFLLFAILPLTFQNHFKVEESHSAALTSSIIRALRKLFLSQQMLL